MARTLYMVIRVPNKEIEQVDLAIDAEDYMNTMCQDGDVLINCCLEAMWQHEERWAIDEPIPNVRDGHDYQVAVLKLCVPDHTSANPYPNNRYEVMLLVIDCVCNHIDLDWEFVLPHRQ